MVTHTAVFSDASDVAFGGFCVSIDGSPVSGMLTRDEMSSTFRELKAMYYVLLSYADQLRNKRVKIFTDNQGTARIVPVGSPNPHLQAIALDIFQICTTYGIIINSQWIPWYLNERADILSRFVDKDDWSISPAVFRVIDAKWGPHTIDRFPSHYNAQTPRYNSKFASPGCSGVDALAQDWSRDNNWICPPVGLIIHSVRLLMSVSGVGTLIVPEWPSSYFWPFLHTGSTQFKPFVTDCFKLPLIHDLIIEGPGQRQIYQSNSPIFSGCPSSKFSCPSSSFRFSVRYYPASGTCSHKAGSKGGGGGGGAGEVVANTFLAMEGFIIRAIVNVIWATVNAS